VAETRCDCNDGLASDGDRVPTSQRNVRREATIPLGRMRQIFDRARNARRGYSCAHSSGAINRPRFVSPMFAGQPADVMK
jgi:hypothetical protein